MKTRMGAALLVLLVLTACDRVLPHVGPRPLPSPIRSEYKSKRVSKGLEFWPRSGQAEPGVAYAFDTGHCGLSFLTDFDGSFWDPVNPIPGGDPPSFFVNEDRGTMTLRARDLAFYLSSGGLRVRLTRHNGPVILKGVCA